jgi:type I restriction enzyme S subunit
MSYIKLGDICDVVKGEIGITKAVPGEFPMVTTGENRISHNKFQLDTEAVLVPLVSATGHGHASIKRVHYQEGKFAFGSILAACVPKNEQYSARFLHIYLQLMKDYVLVPLMKGSANVSLTLGNLKTAKVPNISRERQESIVSLYELIKVEQDQVINELGIQNRDITSLREAILQEAVQGKLTAQWRKENPTLEPASELLKRIEAEKQQLIAEKKIKKEKPLPPIEDEDKPYDLPEGWIWSRLGDLCLRLIDGNYGESYPKKHEFLDEGIPFFTAAAVGQNYEIKDHKVKFISPSKHLLLTKAQTTIGDVLLTNRGGRVGDVALISDEKYTISNIGPQVTRIAVAHDNIHNEYIMYCIASPMFQRAILEMNSGSAMNFMNLTKTANMFVALPPKLEQKKIVKKVNSLMTLCDELEQQIDNSQIQIEQLMQSCLKEVFEN